MFGVARRFQGQAFAAGDVDLVALAPDGAEEGFVGVVGVRPGALVVVNSLDDGTVVGWGKNNHGQADSPNDLGPVQDIDAGNDHSLALLVDGTVVAWGGNSYGQCDVPDGLTDVVAIAAGRYLSVALKSDGTVLAWGATFADPVDPPHGLDDVVAITAGTTHIAALKADGTVVAWGQNEHQQCNTPSNLFNATAITAGIVHTAVLADESWGSYPLLEDDNVDTGDWIGWVMVGYAPWIWNYSLNNWIYVPSNSADARVGSIYFPRF